MSQYRSQLPTEDKEKASNGATKAGGRHSLPSPTVKSGDLFTFVTSGSRGWARYYSDTGSLFLRIGNLDHDSITLDLRDIQRVKPPAGAEGVRTKVKSGDILISITADVGMIGIVPEGFEEAFINQHVALARPVSTVHAPYLAWQLASPLAQAQLRNLQRGATKVGLGLDDIREVDVLLPPLPEQKRIVAEIEKQFTRLDAGIASLKRVQANLKRYRASVLKAACEGRLVPTEAELARAEGRTFEPGLQLLDRILTERCTSWQGRGKYQEPVAARPAHTAGLPEGWTLATFEQLSRRVTVGFVGTMKHQYVTHGIPFLRSQNVRENKFDAEGLLYVSKEFHTQLSKSALQPGDLAVVRSGSVGVTCVIPDSLPCANCSDLVLIQRPLGLVPQYGAYYMNSLARRHIAAGKVGVALIHFNTKSVAALSVRLPPLAEQVRIVAEVERRLSVIEELETLVTANLKRASRLRQSILQKAFTGQLTS